MYLLLTVMFLKSILMIQKSIEEQMQSAKTLRRLIKVNKSQMYFFGGFAVLEMLVLVIGVFFQT